MRLFGGRTREHGPDVCLFAGSGDFGECESSDSLNVEEVEGVRISLLGQPSDETVQVLDEGGFFYIAFCGEGGDQLFSVETLGGFDGALVHQMQNRSGVGRKVKNGDLAILGVVGEIFGGRVRQGIVKKQQGMQGQL